MTDKRSKRPLISKFQYKVRAVSTGLSFNKLKDLLVTFYLVLPTIVSIATRKVKVLPRLKVFTKFINHVIMTSVEHGALYTVKYLRASHVAIQHVIAGRPLKSLRVIEPDLPLPKLRTGLPVCIPVVDRKMIRNGHPETIRLWLTLFSIYRLLEAPRKVKINTITDPFNGSYAQLGNLYGSFGRTIRLLRNTSWKQGVVSRRRLSAKWLRLTTAGGPNGPHAFAQILPDLLSLVRYPCLTNAFVAYCQATESTNILQLFMEGQALLHNIDRRESFLKDGELYAAYTRTVSEQVVDPITRVSTTVVKQNVANDFINKPDIFEEFERYGRHNEKVNKITFPGTLNNLEPGRIVGIPEPAGKMRVIALVDAWTQSVFEPLHEVLFDVLRLLPNDGTFDQDASYDRVQRKSLEAKGIYCADLSAATDRLPLLLQENILNSIFGKSIGTHWADLLRSRPFVSREPLGSLKAEAKVYYGAGQPMGCLSSWAMLALTHHFILQGCCYNLGMTNKIWHTCYEILGDDIVIFDKNVYLEYVSVMSLLNVETNPTKSLISEGVNKVVEFAKRTSINGVDVSGLSWRQFIVAKNVRAGVIPLSLWLANRGLITTPGQLIRLLSGGSKGGYHLLSDKYQKIVNNFVVSLLNHFASIGMVSLRGAFCYLVDPRNGEADLSVDKLPMTTIMHDLLVMFKEISPFRDTNFFDKSKLMLGDTLYREYLVGEKLLPFWGYRTDRSLQSRLNKLSFSMYDVHDKIIAALSPHVFPKDLSEGTSFEVDFHYYLRRIVDSLLTHGCNDQVRIVELSMALKNSIEFKSFEKSIDIHSDITLFLEKYSFMETLGIKSRELGDKIPLPLKDVELAYLDAIKLSQAKGPEAAPMMDYLHLQRSSRGARRNVLLNPKAYL